MHDKLYEKKIINILKTYNLRNRQDSCVLAQITNSNIAGSQ